ncbi:hypothetical protein [Aeromonas media]|uniref:hypothetical protein n=1 Tax=Aeromonas media TaxID=651 RepID=UPI0038D14458
MNKIHLKINATLIALVVTAGAVPVHAASRFTCDFPKMNGPLIFQWNGDSAVLVGGSGQAEVTPIEGIGGVVTFVEVTPGGSVQVTAIERDGGAVHGRHTIIPDGKVLESQVRGTCTREQVGE